MAIPKITVTGLLTNQATGLPATGSLRFKLTGPLEDSVTGEIVEATAQDVAAAVDGTFSASLYATDYPQLVTARNYSVRVYIDGEPTQYFPLSVPYNSPGGTALFTSLTPAGPAIASYVLSATFNAEVTARTVADGAEAVARAGVQTNLNTHAGLSTTAHGGLVASSDARLTDARTPTAHGPTHNTGGTDPLYLNFGNDSTTRVESIPRWLTSGSLLTLVSGAVQFTYFTPQITLTISNLLVASGAAGVSISLVRMGLYTVAGNNDLTLVAQCAADATILAGATTIYTRALSTASGYPASYQIVRGTRYAFGLVAVFSSTAPSVRACTSLGSLYALDPVMTLHKTAQADLPTSQTFAGGASDGALIWQAAT
jgi:hypothetical protein